MEYVSAVRNGVSANVGLKGAASLHPSGKSRVGPRHCHLARGGRARHVELDIWRQMCPVVVGDR